MTTTTQNLGLFKYNTDTDGALSFNINQALNDNWDIIDENVVSSSFVLGETGYLKMSNGFIINYGLAYTGTQEATFTTPKKSSNGTLGGNSFAVAASSVYQTLEPYKMFDKDYSNASSVWRTSGSTGWVKIYNPDPIKITQLRITNHNNGASGQTPTKGNVYGSNDNSNWTLVTTWTNSVTTNSGKWYISMADNSNFYNYYKWEITDCSGSTIIVCEIDITATYIVYATNSITFPYAFTTDYSYALSYYNGGIGNSCATALSTTGMSLYTNSNAEKVYYIAMGY